MSDPAGQIAVFIEPGKMRVFASALDWPGWARPGKTEEAAVMTLADYLPRYAPIVARAGLRPPDGDLVVAERHPGVAGTRTSARSASSLRGRAGRCRPTPGTGWPSCSKPPGLPSMRPTAAAPAQLRKGPRGGGRDTDQIIEHVIGAEAAFARKIGVRHRRPAIDDAAAVAAMRVAIAAAIGQASDGTAPQPGGWPTRYAARRIAWHVLDHAWEIEDKSEA